MGRRGPPPTPTAILKARGSRRTREREDEVRYPAGAPTCPSWLGKEAKAEWKRQARALEDAGVLAEVDRAILAAYCEAWGEFRELIERIREMGGPAVAWRLVNLKNAAAERMTRLAQQFGFSPASRARVKAPEGGDEDGEGSGKARYFAAG